jgi:hypothetical protein
MVKRWDLHLAKRMVKPTGLPKRSDFGMEKMKG